MPTAQKASLTHWGVKIMNTAPYKLLGLDHVVIRARDIKTMMSFYLDVLNCEIEREVADIGLYQLRAGRALIDLVDMNGVLGEEGGAPPGDEGHNMDHLCLRIEPWDPDAISTHLKAHNVDASPVKSRNGAEGEGPSIYLNDPEGNRIEIKGPATAM